jgi:hypothetical protein
MVYPPSVRHQKRRRSCGDVVRIGALAFFNHLVQHYRDAFISIFIMDSMDSVQYHIKTLMLFTKSDIKTVVIPVVCRAVCTKSANTLLKFLPDDVCHCSSTVGKPMATSPCRLLDLAPSSANQCGQSNYRSRRRRMQ